jgi:hypothetical protein
VRHERSRGAQLSVSESASLERGYQRLLALYPKWFRQENEEEILAVLMACARDDQTRPSREAAFDLLKGAARMRLRPRPGQPRAVFAAVRLLWFGAFAELGALVTVIATTASVQATVARSSPASVQSSGLHILADEVLAPVVIAAWLLLARGISRRSDSARGALAAFFGLITLSMLAVLAGGAPVYATADFAAGATVWFICLVSMVLILTPASNRYFRPEPTLVSRAG